MANILQVTNTPVVPNRGIPEDPKIGDSEKHQQIQNPVDPSRVVRADGQETKNGQDALKDGGFGVIDYESNYGAFFKKISDGGLEASQLVERLLLKDGAKTIFDSTEETEALFKQLTDSIRMEKPEELLSFFKGQTAAQAKFAGSLFDSFRSVFKENAPGELKETALAFLKVYNDHSSGTHFLNQMRTIGDDIRQLLFRGFQDEYDGILREMDWTAQNGSTEANTALLNDRLIPFLSNYISRTHDYGAVRDAAMLFIYYAVRYENGSQGRLADALRRLMNARGYNRFFKEYGNVEKVADGLKEKQEVESREFSDALSGLLREGVNGRAGLENIQQFYNALDSILLNESVYAQVLHLLLPFSFQGKDVSSEAWIDPDAEKDDVEGGRCIRLLLNFTIDGTGDFQLFLNLKNRNADIHLGVPEHLLEKSEQIRNGISEIFKKNGMDARQLVVEEATGEIRAENVFPVLKEKGGGVNVRI